jgi:hypothetical protein
MNSIPIRMPPTPIPEPNVESSGVELIHLATCHCRWPTSVDEYNSHLFCGKPTAGGAYCETHRILAYAPARARPIPVSRGW